MQSFLSKLISPPVLLGLFMLDFLWVLLLLNVAGVRGLLLVAVLALGLLALALVSRLTRQARESEQALKENERYIESVASLSQDIHSIYSADDHSCLYMSSAVEALLGYTPEAFLKGGMDYFYSLLHPDDRERVKISVDQLNARKEHLSAKDKESVWEWLFRIRDNHGDWRWLKSRQQVFRRHSDGKPKEILWVAHDFTEHRSVEVALVQAQKYESLGTLARGVAHDINNLLMGIQGFTDLASERMNDPDVLTSNLEKVQENVRRASQLCRQMLAYSGHGRIQVVRHQLNDTVRECLPLVESLIPEGANLELSLENDLPLIEADPSRIRHALINLVVNAAESVGTEPGSEIIIKTKLKKLQGDLDPTAHGLKGDHICLEVCDNGTGMTEDIQHQIFDPYFSAMHPGRGLGLSTVLGIVREHKGAVHVESKLGKGSVVSMYLPIVSWQEIDVGGDEATPVTGMSGVLLLVDDEPTIRSVLRTGFENAGFKVIEAVDGVDGFGAFVRHRSSISAVVLDLTMPRMGGKEVFAEIHKIAPEIPVILMSGYTQQEATANLVGKGLAGFLPKPCSIKEALVVINRALGRPTLENP